MLMRCFWPPERDMPYDIESVQRCVRFRALRLRQIVAYPFPDFCEISVWHHIDVRLKTGVLDCLPIPLFIERPAERDVVSYSGILTTAYKQGDH